MQCLNYSFISMDINKEKIKRFQIIKQKAEEDYKKIDKVYNPFLRRKVSFNAKGLDHIKLKQWNKTRLLSDQFLRIKFLCLVPKIIEKSTTLQEYNETKNFERINMKSKWQKMMVPVKYYGFVSIVDYKIKIKVIVKEIVGGQPFFWSIIPFWKTKNDPILEETKKVFHDGDLEND